MQSLLNSISARNLTNRAARFLLIVSLIGGLTLAVSNLGTVKRSKGEVSATVAGQEHNARVMHSLATRPNSEKPHTVAASYYRVQDGLQATLTLNNKGPNPLEVEPTLFSLFGDRFDVPSVTVDATSFQVIDLSEWALLAGPTFREGSLQLVYRGPDLQLGAQVKLIDPSLSLISDEQLVEPAAMFSSSQLEGVWWLPTKHCQVNLALSNTTDTPVSVFVAIEGIAPELQSPAELLLQAHETRVMDIGKTYREKQARSLPKVGGISIRHSGPKGALLASGSIQDSLIGYSSAIRFGDPHNTKSSRLHGAGLRLSDVAGEQLAPVVVARNVSDTKAVLTGRIAFISTDGSPGEVPIDKIKLGAGETRALKLSATTRRLQRHETVSAGLEFEYDSKPGSVIISALSTSETRNQVFQVPMLDPLAQRSSTGGYPWFIEAGSSTVVYIKNTSERPQQYAAHLNWTDLQYVLGLKTIQPRQTVALDIRALRDNQVADEQGRRIPLEVTRGQISWSLVRGEVPGDLVLIGRAEQVDLTKAISSSYACQSCCNNGFYSAEVSPYSAAAAINATVDFDAYQTDIDCYGNLSTYNRSFGVSWNTSNSQVATINSSGTATARNAGTATITPSWTIVEYDDPPQPCGPYSPQQPDLPDPCGCSSFAHTVSPQAGLAVDFDFFITFNSYVLNPSGTPGGTTSTTVTVYTTPPAPNVAVTLFLNEVVVSAGGHVGHGGTRPMGTLAATQGTTGANGTFQTTYTAPIFGGQVGIFARFGTFDRGEPMQILVYDLSSLGAGANYHLVGSTASHPDNHYGTSTALNNLPLIAGDYRTQFYGQNQIPAAERLRYNDMSLTNGGKFDLSNNWCANCSHAEHRVGINCDVGSGNVAANRRQALEAIFQLRGSPGFLNEGDHWHLRF